MLFRNAKAIGTLTAVTLLNALQCPLLRADTIITPEPRDCVIYLDWDNTFYDHDQLFHINPAPGACEALNAAINSCLDDGSDVNLCSGSLRGVSDQDWANVMNDCGVSSPVGQPGTGPCADLRCDMGGGSGPCDFDNKLPRLCAQADNSSTTAITLIDNNCSGNVDCGSYGYPGAGFTCTNLEPPPPTPTPTPPPSPSPTPPPGGGGYGGRRCDLDGDGPAPTAQECPGGPMYRFAERS